MEGNSSDYLAAASLAVSTGLILYKAYRRYVKSTCRGEVALSVAASTGTAAAKSVNKKPNKAQAAVEDSVV